MSVGILYRWRLRHILGLILLRNKNRALFWLESRKQSPIFMGRLGIYEILLLNIDF